MKALVGAFNQEKALVGAFSVITNLRMELFEALETWPAEGSKVKVNSWVEAATKNPLVAVMKETIIRYNGNPSRAILCSLVLYCLQWVLLGFRRSYSRFSYGKPSEEAL